MKDWTIERVNEWTNTDTNYRKNKLLRLPRNLENELLKFFEESAKFKKMMFVDLAINWLGWVSPQTVETIRSLSSSYVNSVLQSCIAARQKEQ